MRELDVVGVRVEMPSNAPMVLVARGWRDSLPADLDRSRGGCRHRECARGHRPAQATHARPDGRHADDLGHRLTEVHITELEGGTFYAVLLVDGIEVSARPSDAIALALRVGSDIYCAEDVLDEAGIEIPEAEEDEVEKFREFLDQVNPDDFVTGEEPKS